MIPNPKSQYGGTPVDGWHLGYWVGREVPTSEYDKIVTINQRYEGRPDLLSYDEYGTPSYWWVFAIRNPDTIIDPVNDFKAGRDIYIPKMT